jgi:hypothetical protein
MENRAPAQWLRAGVKFELVVVGLVVITGLFVWMGTGGPAWSFLTSVVVGLPLFLRRQVRDLRNRIVGARGEIRVAKALLPLEGHGYLLLHDVQTGHGNIDHVVVGPTGVFALETKAWKGRVYVKKGQVLTRNGVDETRTVRQAVGEAMEVRRRMARLGMKPWVQSYVVLTRTKLPRGPIRLSKVAVLEVGDLVAEVLSKPESLSPRQVALATSAILTEEAGG